SLAGFVTEVPVSHGLLSFTAINQTQNSTFTRPLLGFQGASSLTAGITGAFDWNAPLLTRLASALPFGATKVPSHISLNAELASSHPQFGLGSQGQAYVETFDTQAGTSIPLADISWYYSSMPAYGNTLRRIAPFEMNNAATLVWQTLVKDSHGNLIRFTQTDIDSLTHLAGTGVQFNESVLWLSLLPLSEGGRFNRATKQYDWTVTPTPTGRRWRSIRTVLSPSGIDLTNHDLLQFWTLVDTSITARGKNPTLVFDFGDISENSLTFAPETLTIVHNANGTVDSLFTGRRVQGFDSLDTERDPFTRAFNVEVNDTGLPGDVVDTLVVIDGTTVKRVLRAPLCRGALGSLDYLGDPQADCTVGNSRLDEEDIDQDNALNFTSAQREHERLLRYVVDLSNPAMYKRVGGSYSDTVVVNGVPRARKREWVLVSIPFKSPTDSLNDVNRRRIRALRLSVVSGALQADDEPTQLPIAELQITGAPWIDRADATLAGIGGIRPDGGFVVASTIGTNDSSTTVVYQPPPGVTDETATKGGQFAAGLTAINERSMRLQAGNMPLYHRAETYFRFPAGPQNYFAFRQLHVWGRGRGDGWGQNGELQMYVKLGRDENNFYMYRTPVNSGQTPAAWTDVAVDFNRFIDLRKKIQAAYLAGKSESISCTGADSAMIAMSPVPAGVVAHRFAACSNGYMVYTIDPAVAAPNLESVQEIAVGMLRVGATGAASILPSDTLELWVDDIRLTNPVNAAGTAGQVAVNMNLADFADLRVNVGNRDPNFRQLGEQPTFQSQRNVDIASTIRLEKLLPRAVGLALPLTITKLSLASDPLFLSGSDISGRGLGGVRAPRNDLTTYSLSVRRTAPVDGGLLGPLVNNLSATTTYVTGVDRTEFQDGNSHNLTVALDYLVTDDSARTATLPSWVDGALGALPAFLQDGPINTLRNTVFRWNPTQIRFTSGIVRADDRRVSYLKPSDPVTDAPATSQALSRLWRNGGVLELRPTGSLDARWELQSTRDMRDYGDSLARAQGFSQAALGVGQGFERERSMLTSFSFAPAFSSWFHPRTDVGAQYNMLRDPNVRSFTPLPGVIGIDSVLAARDSANLPFALPRRMTAAQTGSIGAMIDVARAFTAYTRDSGTVRRIGKLFAPIDVSYTRSLLGAIDESPVDAPLSLQLGFGGAGAFRRINGVNATTAGRTGTLDASGALLLPLGTSFVSRFRHVTTDNWILRPDSSQALAAGVQTTFPDVMLRWGYRPAAATALVSNLDASAGYAHSTVGVSLPNFASSLPPEIRRTNQETFPFGASIAWSFRGAPSTGLHYQHTNRVDSLPGSVARSYVDEISADAGRAFHIPESWGLGLKSDVRTRLGFQQSHTITHIFGEDSGIERRLQDNGRQSITLAGDTNVQDDLVLTFQGSRVVTFDNNLNRRFAQTVFSIVFQLQMFGSVK
ncbi:MAG TPA: cell surface protein SprA, partial [Gemmatimonadaceae bacterium]|nr:cell surface protein SprA [Gemmatimonadaceae bacterium]